MSDRFLKIEDVRQRVQKLVADHSDDEQAHSDEDQLYRDVLRAIADGRCGDPAALAAEALQAYDIQFARWCA